MIKPPFLTTTFSESGKQAKKRFDNILNTKVKKTGVFALVAVILMIVITGAIVKLNQPERYMDFSEILSYMGKDKQTLLNESFLKPDLSEAEISKQGNEETISTIGWYDIDHKNEIKTGLIFYNDINIGFKFTFDDYKIAYEYATAIRKDLEKIYGTKTTYPGVTATNQAYFDELEGYKNIKELTSYYEDFTVNLGDVSHERVDIRFNMIAEAPNNISVVVRYSVATKQKL